jgi:hypothetical protein
MLVGTWVLVLLPLVVVLKTFDWALAVPVPTVFDFRGTVRTLDDTLLCYWGVYEPLAFCIGVVLLFSNERARRPGPLDWTRRWGVICSYVVSLLSAAQVLFIAALVLAGIAAVFHSMPLENQPRVTPWLVELSAAYLRYGPHPRDVSVVVLSGVSSIAILLACAALFDALRSSGPKWLAVILLAPLALIALMHLAQAIRLGLGLTTATPTDQFRYAVYFSPAPLVQHIADLLTGVGARRMPILLLVEAAKWCTVFVIAVWLSTAQLAAWWQRQRARAA